MLTALIAERDAGHRKHIMELLDWGRLGYEVIGHLEDGIAALETIFAKWPDIVFLNDDLPGLDGIEIIERAKEHGLSCHFVLVSANRDFETARRAMRLGVEEYLLKPVEGSELSRVLNKYTERRRAFDGQDINERFLQTRRLLRNSFMDNFTAIESPEDLSIEDLNQRYRFALREEIFQSAVMVVGGLPNEEYPMFLPALVENIRARFDPVCHELIPYVQGMHRLTLIFNYSPDSFGEGRMSELNSIMLEHLHKRGCDGASFSIGVGRPENDVRKLRLTLETAEWAMRCGIIRERNRIYFYGSLKFDKMTSIDILTPTLLSELKGSAESLNIDSFEKAVRSAFSPISQYTNPAVIIDICWAAVEAVADVCGDDDSNANDAAARKKILDALGERESLTDVIYTLTEWTRGRFDRSLKEREYTRPVREAKRYIRDNCTQPLTLERVSAQVHLNPSYFSTVFKKETGQNFSDFLISCRVEEAKRLLRETGMSISQICYAVGYIDNKHFSRIFTKLVGVKPSTYRSLHG